VHYGKAQLHNHLEEKLREYLEHMDTIEILSTMFGFKANKNEKLYRDLIERLKVEMQVE
jgi:hypothetical protein